MLTSFSDSDADRRRARRRRRGLPAQGRRPRGPARRASGRSAAASRRSTRGSPGSCSRRAATPAPAASTSRPARPRCSAWCRQGLANKQIARRLGDQRADRQGAPDVGVPADRRRRPDPGRPVGRAQPLTRAARTRRLSPAESARPHVPKPRRVGATARSETPPSRRERRPRPGRVGATAGQLGVSFARAGGVPGRSWPSPLTAVTTVVNRPLRAQAAVDEPSRHDDSRAG